jgi:C1A family cysteine protease
MNRLFLSVLLCSVLTMSAQNADQLMFTTILSNPITPVKNQSRSGTCWDYATIGFVEAELLRTRGKVYDLSEMFVANKDYVDCAEYHVRMHGCSRFSEGGSADDVFAVIDRHGICPETAMAGPGEMIGYTLANCTEGIKTRTP